ncbi:class I SAM-dependent methyltransferase [Puniceibacterium sediminis]|uniref:Methyltransferase domain-containing protein n=1 Tax=Puniceibacterium sediminis TaxID=1608407 RepID=A0A238YPF1_9RHOB|nr:methyltransferase domain-containing protein [Puniceibacterium sediminis]SNR72473.1 Methyltransferase domain-containing protein [Puniceibacterium sediminis]
MSEKKNFIPEQYNPAEYWNTRDQPNTGAKPGVSKPHADFFAKHVSADARILEMGPGIGRMFPLYAGARDATFSTVDLTEQHRATLDAAAAAEGLTVKQNHIKNPDDPYPFEDKSFDVTVSSFVLLHVPFEYIRKTMLEMLRVSHRVVVFDANVSTRAKSEAERTPSTHVFGHDYEALCSELGLTVFDRALFRMPNPQNQPFALIYGRA